MQLLNDLFYAARTLRRSPGYTIIAVLTLALGLGANVAVFSVVNALILRPQAFPDPERVVLLRTNVGNEGAGADRFAAADFLDLQRANRAFSHVAAVRCAEMSLSVTGQTDNALACSASPSFFQVTGIQPANGRAFTPDEAQPGRDAAVVLRYGFWQREFAADPDIVGKTVKINGIDRVVTGIMPLGFNYPAGVDMWLPLALASANASDRVARSLQVLGRMRPDVSIAAARTELAGFSNRLSEQYPQTNSGRKFTLIRLREEQYSFTMPLFLTLQAAALLVLLLACSNLTNLTVARAVGREREMAVRTALGGSRFRIARLIMSETLLLTLLGAAIATGISFWTVDLIRNSMSPNYTKWIAGWDTIHVDSNVLETTLLIALAAAFVLGLSAVLSSSRVSLGEALKAGSGRLMGGFRAGRVRGILASSQIVFALVLLVAAGSLIKNFRALMDVYQAYEPTRVLKVRIALPEKGFPDNPRMTAYYDRLLTGIRALPGVLAAGIGANIPASNVENRRASYVVDGNPVPKPAETPASDTMIVSPGFLESLRVPVFAGRSISAQDGPDSPRVALVSESFARHEWPNGSAPGHRLRIVKAGAPETVMTIVGVVADVQQNWWDQKGRPVIYYPYSQTPQRGMVLLARTSGDPLSLAGAVRSVASSVALDVPLNTIQTMNGEVVDAMAPIQILGSLVALFGSLALTLAAIGIYGLLAFGVARRTREFGMRAALGATPRDLCKLVFANALKLTAIGLAIGIPLAIYLSRAVGRVLFGAADVSAAIIAAFSTVILLSAIAAGLVPALRAMRVDPLQALHLE